MDSRVAELLAARTRAWAKIALPAFWLSAVFSAGRFGAQMQLLCAVLVGAWCALSLLGQQRGWARLAEHGLVVGMFGLFDVSVMGPFTFSIISAAVILELRRGVALVGLTTLGCACVLLLVPGDRSPISSFAMIFPATGIFAIGRALRSSVLNRDQAERLAEDLAAANARLERSLAALAELATARERARIARELHDSLGHCLTNSHVHLQLAQRTLDGDPDQAREALARAHAATTRGLAELRRCVALVHEPSTPRSLPAVMRELIELSRAPSSAIEFEVLGRPRKLGSVVEFVLFRALQEALTNAARHAGSCTILVSLSYTEARVCLRIVDDGRGADLARIRQDSFGLIGLADRVEAVGGRLEIASSPGAGFSILVEVGEIGEVGSP